MKLNEIFTPEQLYALSFLKKELGIAEVTIEDIHEGDVATYAEYAHRALSSSIRYFTLAQFSETIDFQEIKRLKQEARDKRLAERAESTRESLVLNFMTAIIPKLVKTFPEYSVTLSQDENFFSLTVDTNDPDHNEHFIQMVFIRESYELRTYIERIETIDDLTLVNGNTSPRAQIRGLNYLFIHMEE